MDTIDNRTSGLINYYRQGSNSNNYGGTDISSSPESFPYIMENGILIEYNTLDFSSDITPEEKVAESD